jgi:hypothetical protein
MIIFKGFYGYHMSSFPCGIYSYRSPNYTLPNQINPMATIYFLLFFPILPLFFHLMCKQTIPSPLLSPLTNLWPFILFCLKEQQSHPFPSLLVSLMFRPYSHGPITTPDNFNLLLRKRSRNLARWTFLSHSNYGIKLPLSTIHPHKHLHRILVWWIFSLNTCLFPLFLRQLWLSKPSTQNEIVFFFFLWKIMY